MGNLRRTAKRVVLGPDKEWWDEHDQRGVAGAKSVELYGLTAPLGAVMIAAAGDIEGWWHVSHALLFCAAVAGAGAWGYACRRAYGDPPTSLVWADVGLLRANLRDVPKAAAFVLGLLTYGALLAVSGLTDIYVQPPVSITGLSLILALLLTHLWAGTYQEDPVRKDLAAKLRRRMLSSHYLVMAALVAIVSLVPLSGLLPSWRLFADAAVFGITAGAAMVVGGILDHRLLRRMTRAIPGPREESWTE